MFLINKLLVTVLHSPQCAFRPLMHAVLPVRLSAVNPKQMVGWLSLPSPITCKPPRCAGAISPRLHDDGRAAVVVVPKPDLNVRIYAHSTQWAMTASRPKQTPPAMRLMLSGRRLSRPSNWW